MAAWKAAKGRVRVGSAGATAATAATGLATVAAGLATAAALEVR
jgi:hypothetical protein